VAIRFPDSPHPGSDASRPRLFRDLAA